MSRSVTSLKPRSAYSRSAAARMAERVWSVAMASSLSRHSGARAARTTMCNRTSENLDPQSGDSPMCNCTSVVQPCGLPRNDEEWVELHFKHLYETIV